MTFEYKNNQLYCENILLQEIAEEFGTPLYLYSKKQLVENFRTINNAFGNIDHTICYALKANSNPEILKILVDEGAGADVVSGGELFLALKSGFSPSTITFAGVGKRDDEIEYALKENIHSFNVESLQELDVINSIAKKLNTKARIALRINPDIDAQTHPYISTGLKVNKFGIDISVAMDAFRYAHSLSNLLVEGIHTHIGSQITTVEPFVQTAKTIAKLVDELRKENITIRFIDFGGGFGITYKNALQHPLLPKEETTPQEQAPSLDSFITSVLPILQHTGCKLFIEPGRSIIANTGILLTKVLFTKENSVKKFVIVDAGMTELLRPSLYNAYHQIVPLTLSDTPPEKVDVVGPVCETGDFFARERMLQPLQRGEYCAVLNAGAYGFTLASHYNARPFVAEILVNDDKIKVIRKREEVFNYQ